MERAAHVLVAEDESLAAMALELLLTGRGFQVSLASDGQEALDMASANCPDLLITDLRMPGLDGRGLIQRIRQSCPTLPIVVMTGYPPPGGVADLQAGTAPLVLLTKPIDPTTLVASMQALLS